MGTRNTAPRTRPMTAAPPTRNRSDVHTTTAPAPVRALIAPDKFKGSLTAAEVAGALAAGLRSAAEVAGRPGAVHCELLPLADGGDGSVDAAVTSGFTRHRHTVTGPTGQPVPAGIAFDGT